MNFGLEGVEDSTKEDIKGFLELQQLEKNLLQPNHTVKEE